VTNFVEVASDLSFPEGPVALPDGSVVLVEMMKRCITRIMPDATKQVVAEIAGGPNGLAIGPDGALYLCNNGSTYAITAARSQNKFIMALPTLDHLTPTYI